MWEIVGVVVAGVSALIAYIAVHEKRKQNRVREYEKRREEKEKQKEKEEDERKDKYFREFRDLIREDMGYFIEQHIKDHHAHLITIEESKEGDDGLKKRLSKIESQLEKHFNESMNSEIGRLATDIMNYAEDLRIGIKKSRSSYKHIAHCYDRYKRLGGNHYIDSEFAYIKKVMADEEA